MSPRKKCKGQTQRGTPCKLMPRIGSKFCHIHGKSPPRLMEVALVGAVRAKKGTPEIPPEYRERYQIHKKQYGQLLIEAAEGGDNEKVRELIRLVANIDEKDDDEGNTTLMHTSSNGHLEIVKLLLENGANPNIKNNYGITALMLAAWEGHRDVVKLLLEAGANVNEKDDHGETVIMNTSGEGYTEIVELLLEYGANVNEKNRSGETALLNASYDGHIDVVKLLLEAGADPNIKYSGGRKDIMELLIQYGAK